MTDISKLEQVAGQAAEKIMQAAEKYGPDAVALTTEVGRVAAVQVIVTGIVFAVAAIIAFAIGAKLFKRGMEQRELYRKTSTSDDGFGWFMGCVVVSFVAVMAGIPAVLRMSDAFAWVGLFRPEIYLAAKLLNL